MLRTRTPAVNRSLQLDPEASATAYLVEAQRAARYGLKAVDRLSVTFMAVRLRQTALIAGLGPLGIGAPGPTLRGGTVGLSRPPLEDDPTNAQSD